MSIGGHPDNHSKAAAFVFSAVAAPLPLVLYILFGLDVSDFDNGHDGFSVVVLVIWFWGMGFLTSIMMAIVVAFPIYTLISRKYRVGLMTSLSAGLIIGLITYLLLHPIFAKDAAVWMAVFAACGLFGGFTFWWVAERIQPQ